MNQDIGQSVLDVMHAVFRNDDAVPGDIRLYLHHAGSLDLTHVMDELVRQGKLAIGAGGYRLACNGRSKS